MCARSVRIMWVMVLAPNSVDTKCCMFNPADSKSNVKLLNLGVLSLVQRLATPYSFATFVNMQALQMLPVVHLLHVTLDW